MTKWSIEKLKQWEVQWMLACLRRKIEQSQSNLATQNQIYLIASLEAQLFNN